VRDSQITLAHVGHDGMSKLKSASACPVGDKFHYLGEVSVSTCLIQMCKHNQTFSWIPEECDGPVPDSGFVFRRVQELCRFGGGYYENSRDSLLHSRSHLLAFFIASCH
jgi:hypothetical protein